MSAIAIVGMAGLFPGAASVGRFWDDLLAGRDATSLATAEELGVDPQLIFDPIKGRRDKSYCLRGGYVREAPFDPVGLRLPAELLGSLDEVARWSLQVAREALRDGGRPEGGLARCGLVLGSLSFPTRSSNRAFLPIYEAAIEAALRELLDRPDLHLPRSAEAGEQERARRLLEPTPATLVAGALGLGGPSFCIDAACASSLYAVALAAEALRAGSADLMLAGAVSCADPFSLHQGFSIFQAYPEQGQASRPLDRSTRGLVAGEGAGMLLLKRYEDALRDGDRIDAVVRAVGLSNDGRGRHPLVPSPQGQLRAFERTYAAADLDPGEVPYVECHATGTPLGDPVELAAMEQFFARGGSGRGPLIGSVKSNVGHLLTAAGMASMIKVALALRHGLIPPTVGVEDPLASERGLIGGEGVVRETIAWPPGAPRRAGVSAFGFGGTNAHLVLELPDEMERARRPAAVGAAAPVGAASVAPGRPIAVAGSALLVGDRSELPRQRWKGMELLLPGVVAPRGAYLEGFEVDFLRYRVPPTEAERPIAQQLALLSVADRAVAEAGLTSGGNVAVIVAMGTELELHQYRGRVEMGWRVRQALERAGVELSPDEVAALTELAKDALHPAASVNQYVSFIGNVMASRVSSLHDFSGPALTVSADRASSRRALELAALLLARGEVEAAVVGAVELGGSVEAVTARPGRTPTDGAAALVLRRARAGDRTIDPSAGDEGLVRLVEQLGGASPARGTARLVLGGRPIREAIVTPENVRRFRRPPAASPIGTAGQAAQTRAAAAEMVAAAAAAQGAAHLALLRARHEAANAIAAAVGAQIAQLRGQVVPTADPGAVAPSAIALLPDAVVAGGPIWGEAELLEFARGRIATVFGPAYAPIDAFRRRVRLPMPPYLLVSRVTHLRATLGRFERAEMTTEYDVPADAWYAVDGQVPCAIAVESGQCDLLLVAYLGIDFQNRGERVYRLLDCTLTFLDALPRVGETLRYEITIDSFARSGESLLFFFRYDCFVGQRRILEMRGGCAGFFSDAELEQGKGAIYTDAELAARAAAEQRRFEPLLDCPRRAFGPDDLARLSAGDLRSVFGAAHETHGRNPSLRLAPARLRMIDRVVDLDPSGGAHGLGALIAEKDLRPDDWYFPCHFKDDQVLAGSLMAEGCAQLLQVYMLRLGLHTRVRRARFEPLKGLSQVVRCRGQVTPAHAKLTYRLEVTELGLDPEPYAIADAEIVVEGKIVVHIRGLGLRLAEAADGPARPLPAVRKPALFDERKLDEFATGSIAACFGPDFARYERRATARQPNGELQLISRVVEVEGSRLDFAPGSRLVSECDLPAAAWFLGRPEVPYAILMELALQPCGFLSAYLRSTLLFPDEDFHFRNLDGNGRLLRRVDLRGRTVTNRVRLLVSTALPGVILQSFDYELSCDSEPFFVGDAAFGYFTSAGLRNQVGLDGGAGVAPWIETAGGARPVEIVLPRGRDRLELLDRALIVPDGGARGLGYVYAEARVDPHDWFFASHFYQDPVMPGSLGIEAMLAALSRLAGHGSVDPARLRHRLDQATTWRYRGQIVPSSRRVRLELHLKRRDDRLLVADASLWRDDLRIYAATDLSLAVE